MNKIKMVGFIIAGVVVTYLFLLAIMPMINDAVAASSAQIALDPNLASYTGAKEGLDAMPWVMWFLPGLAGGAAVVVVLKS